MAYRYRVSALILVVFLFLNACAPAASIPPPASNIPAEATDANAPAELSELKSYVETQAEKLHASITQLANASDRYFELARNASFDYTVLWSTQSAEALRVLSEARAAFLAANPQYEQMEGIVAGVPSLSQYDIILDAGTSAADSSEDAVPFDLTLPNGKVLPKPGNLFEVTEATLWGTDPAYRIAGFHPDFNGNNQVDLGDALPDANVLKGTADTFMIYAGKLEEAARLWQPTESEAFGALLANVPTFSDFMESWKNSRFVMNDASNERGFVATSRLSDLSDNILSWQKIYAGLSRAVRAKSPEQDAQISRDLENLQKYVSDLFVQESKQGRRFTPEEADMLNAEGQARATGIAGQIAQAAVKLGITIEDK